VRVRLRFAGGFLYTCAFCRCERIWILCAYNCVCSYVCVWVVNVFLYARVRAGVRLCGFVHVFRGDNLHLKRHILHTFLYDSRTE